MKTQMLSTLEQQKNFKPLLIHLLEDSEADVKLLELALEEVELAYELRVIKDAEILVESFDQGSYALDNNGFLSIFMIDLEIPKYSGLELIEKIRNRFPKSEVPVVVHSGSQNSQSIAEAYRLGANAYLYKSINYVESVEHLNAMFKYFSLMYKPD